MKKTLFISSLLASVCQAQPQNWNIEIDNVLDGTVNSSISQSYPFNLETHANKFNGSFSNYPSVHIVQGEIEDQNNQTIGSGIAARIQFTLSTSASVNYHLGKATQTGYQGTWYGPNNESGDFHITTNPTPQPLVPKLTSNTSASPIVVSASTTHNHQSLGPWKAFDHDVSQWYTAQCFEGITGWLQVDFGTDRTVTTYQVRGRDDALQGSYKDWSFEGSADGTNWITLDTPVSQTAWVAGEVRSFNITPATYRYFRWNVSSNNNYVLSCSQGLQLIGY